MVIFLNNIYVFILQVFWRLDKDGEQEFKEILERRNLEKKDQKEIKNELGLNYFDDNIKVKINRKDDSRNSSQITLKNNENQEQKSIIEIQ